MLYVVSLTEENTESGFTTDNFLEEIHVRAANMSEAEKKALAYARKRWEGQKVRIVSIKETDIEIVE